MSSVQPAIGSTFPGAYPQTQAAPHNGPHPQDYDLSRIPGYESASYRTNGYQTNGSGHSQGYGAQQPDHNAAQPQVSGASASCSRNLIGSLSSTAFLLMDTENVPGLFFIMGDLSIRTEGIFRLKFTFFDLMCDKTPLEAASGCSLANYSPLLASDYSDPFQVWSAKRFPGVRPTTALSQAFADQGIKIPVRKSDSKNDNNKRRRPSEDSNPESGDDQD